MIFIQFDRNGKELARHYQPDLLSKECISKGILVQSIPKPKENQSNILMYDGKKLYYEDNYVQKINELQEENSLLKLKTNSISERADFVEDIIAELAIDVYK